MSYMAKEDLKHLLIYASPCAKCGCGSFCHWNDLETPAGGESAVEWSTRAAFLKIPCQRCPCKGYKAKGHS